MQGIAHGLRLAERIVGDQHERSVGVAKGELVVKAEERVDRQGARARPDMAGEMALRMRTDPLTREEMEAGRMAMVSVGKRFFATNKFGLSGPQMIAMRECVDLGDRLLKRANSAILMAVCAAVDEHLRESA